MICITYTSYTRGINLIKSFKDMPMLTLLPVEDYDLPKLETWLKKEHVLRWYHDVDEWMNEIRERNGEFAFLNHYVAYWDNIPVGFGQWYDCFDAKEEWYQVEKPDEMFSIDYFIGEELFLRKGYGKSIIRALVQKIKQHQPHAQIVVQPELDNIASGKALLANGFMYDEGRKYYFLP